MSSATLLTILGVVGAVGVGCLIIFPRRAWCKPAATQHVNTEVGIGTVRAIADVAMIEVESVCGQKFTGRLHHHAGDPALSTLRPGVVLLVAFDPTARDRLSLADDMTAVRAEFDRMLVGKGLLTGAQLDLINHGAKSRAVVVGMRTTGAAREDYREVELDLMVSRVEGGQFPAQETALVPASALHRVSPGSVIDTYYRPGNESAVAVCVPPA